MREQDKGWLSNYVECSLCGYKWVAVYHEDTERLECSNCKNMVLVEIIDNK